MEEGFLTPEREPRKQSDHGWLTPSPDKEKWFEGQPFQEVLHKQLSRPETPFDTFNVSEAITNDQYLTYYSITVDLNPNGTPEVSQTRSVSRDLTPEDFDRAKPGQNP